MAVKKRKPTIKIELTPEQQDMVRKATGQEATTLQFQALTAEELEQRATPDMFWSGSFALVASNPAPDLIGPIAATPIQLP